MQAKPPRVGKKNLQIKRGDTLTFTATFRHRVTKALLDFTGCTFRAQMRATKASTTVLAAFTVTEISQGKLSFVHPASATALLPIVPQPKAVWDFEVTWPGNIVRTLLEGDVDVTGDVSRP